MEWTAPIDLYCERLGEGLVGEPLNALSNVAFFVAAVYGLVVARRAHADWAVWLLAALAGVVGAGSLAISYLCQSLVDACRRRSDSDLHLRYFGFALAPAARPFLADYGSCLLGPSRREYAWYLDSAPQGLLNGSIGYVPALVAAIAMALGAASRTSPGLLSLRPPPPSSSPCRWLSNGRSRRLRRDSDRHAFLSGMC